MNANDRALTACTMLGHATFHTYELVIPVFVALWLESFGVSAALLGLLVGAGYALVGVGALPAGVLSDRYDSKTLIGVSMLGMGGGFALLGLADSIVLVAVGLLVWGATASLYHPAGLSLISRGAEARGTAFAYHGVAGNLGVAAGPFLGALLLAVFPWRTVALLLVVPGVVAVALTTRLEFDETASVDDAATDGGAADGGPNGASETTLAGFADQSRRLLASAFVFVFGIAMLYGLYYRGFLTFLPKVLDGLALFDPVTVAGRTFPPTKYVYAGLLTLGAVGQFAGGKLSDRVRTERALVAIFAALVVVSLLFVPAADAGVAPFLLVCAVLAFFVYMEAPVHQAVVAKYVPSDVHGLSFGYLYLGTFGVGAVGATLAGVVLTYGTDALLFGLLAGFALVAAGVSGWLALRGHG
jgi:MFS family permease